MNRTLSYTTPFLHKHQKSLGCFFLVLVTLAVYWNVTRHEFINFDDPIYVTDNRHVQNGLTPEGLEWAFGLSNTQKTYWHPLTWISHMLDCELYGLKPGGHHLTSLIFHILNGLLLLLVCHQITGVWWRSFFVAALFLLHPLNVDSVAWVAERKNILSTFFWMVTLLAYARYCRKPGLLTYLAVLLAYCLGLLSKPMLVTLPCVLLLLDYWPLCRTKVDLSTSGNPECANLPADTAVQYPVSRLIIEKIPLLILSGISVYISFLSLQNISVVVPSSAVPMYLRVANAVVSYTSYIAKMLFPANLAVYYPYPTSMPPFWQIAGACLFLVLVTISSIINSTRRPYFIIGWLWYLGTLVPVAGIVQGGLWPAMADRWTYIPHIGLFIIIAWGTPELFSRGSHKRRWLAAALPIAVLSVLAASTSIHVRYWKNSITLFSHAIEVTDNNPVAHNNLGNALVQRNQIEAAIRHYQKALRLAPHLVETHRSLGNALQKKGQTDEAIVHYREALRVRPGDEKTLNNLGNVFVKKGQYPEAIKHYREVLRIKPDYAKAHNNIALAYLHNGETLKAIKHLKRAIQINPNYAGARFNLEKIEKSPNQSSAPIRPSEKGP